MHMYELVSREQNINFSGNLPYKLNGSSLTWFTRFNRLYGLFLHNIFIIGFMILYISCIFLIIKVWICITVFIIMIYILIIRSYNISKTSSFFTEGFQGYFSLTWVLRLFYCLDHFTTFCSKTLFIVWCHPFQTVHPLFSIFANNFL